MPNTINHLTPQQIISDIWHFTGVTWDPTGVPKPVSRITMSSADGYSLNLYETISDFTDPDTQQRYIDPLLVTDVGLVVQKDIAAGGFVSANQGELWLGHGRYSTTDVPKIVLSHADPAVYGRDANSNPFDTVYLRKALTEGVGTPANLDLGNISAHGDRVITIEGYSQINWNTTATQRWDDIGSIRFNKINPEDPNSAFGMEFKGMLDEIEGQLYPVIQMVHLNSTLTPGWRNTHEFYPNGDLRI